MDPRRLREFVVTAHRNGYAADEPEIEEERGGKTITYRDDEWLYVDRYFGSRAFVGQETVFYADSPVWGMHYHGAPTDETVDHESLYAFLRDALGAVSNESPYRGPERFEGEAYRYRAETDGELDRFVGSETIESGSETVYRGRYGGCVIE